MFFKICSNPWEGIRAIPNVTNFVGMSIYLPPNMVHKNLITGQLRRAIIRLPFSCQAALENYHEILPSERTMEKSKFIKTPT